MTFDMSIFGHLADVKKDTSPKVGFVQLIFDTGVEMLIPYDLFRSLNLRFSLEQSDKIKNVK